LLHHVSSLHHPFNQAIWRKKPSILTTENIVDIQPEFVNTDKLVSDVTREYVSKLEQVCYLLIYNYIPCDIVNMFRWKQFCLWI